MKTFLCTKITYESGDLNLYPFLLKAESIEEAWDLARAYLLTEAPDTQEKIALGEYTDEQLAGDLAQSWNTYTRGWDKYLLEIQPLDNMEITSLSPLAQLTASKLKTQTLP